MSQPLRGLYHFLCFLNDLRAHLQLAGMDERGQGSQQECSFPHSSTQALGQLLVLPLAGLLEGGLQQLLQLLRAHINGVLPCTSRTRWAGHHRIITSITQHDSVAGQVCGSPSLAAHQLA